MTTYKNDILYFFLVTFNYITELFTYYNTKFKELVEIYNEENRGKWIFLNNYNPEVIPLDSIKNITISDKWIYDSKTNKLIHSNSENHIKIKWLSVELIRHIDINIENPITEVINLDRFFESFELYCSNQTNISLSYLMYCICIKHKIWFLPNDNIRLVIIDEMGNDTHLDIQNKDIIDNCLTINNSNELVLSLNKNN